MNATAAGKQWFGHPRGLSTLFFTEMWERFSYYGMRALLMLFMTSAVTVGGLGWSAAQAGPIYGLYTAMVYIMALPGGWIADRLIGQRRAVLVGGIVIASGHVSLMFHGIIAFYTGLFLIVLGTGLLKPNISTMVGGLYTEEDNRRDAGFSIFYMGINLGAFLAPLACGFLAQHETFKVWLDGMGMQPEDSWHWGFGAAAVGMTLGVIQYVLGGRNLGSVGIEAPGRGDHEQFRKNLMIFAVGTVVFVGGLWSLIAIGGLGAAGEAADAAEAAEPLVVRVLGWLLLALPFVYFAYLLTQKGWNETEKKRLAAIPVFFFAAALFWSVFEQAGSTLTLFADRFTRNVAFGFEFPSSWWQSLNSLFIILLAPLFAILWVRLKKREPSSPAKFSYGLFFVGIGFLVLAFGAMFSGPEGKAVSPLWLFSVYFLHTVGELCLSPVGLSTMTKLAPARVSGQMMGVWFLAAGLGNFIGGKIAGLFESYPLPTIFGVIFGITMFMTVIMVILIKPVRRLMSGVH